MPIKAVQQFMLGTVLSNEQQAKETLAAMKAAGYDGPLSIEQEDYTIPTMDALRQGAALMRKVLA